jgi:CBS domain-containing protein
MHAGIRLPSVPPSAAMPQIMHEMSAKRLGMTTIQTNGKLLGILSDGDLRRLLERNGPHAFHKKAADIMNPKPRTISPEMLAVDALLLLEQTARWRRMYLVFFISTTSGKSPPPPLKFPPSPKQPKKNSPPTPNPHPPPSLTPPATLTHPLTTAACE